MFVQLFVINFILVQFINILDGLAALGRELHRRQQNNDALNASLVQHVDVLNASVIDLNLLIQQLMHEFLDGVEEKADKMANGKRKREEGDDDDNGNDCPSKQQKVV